MTLPIEKPQAGETGWHPKVWNMIDVLNAIEERIRDVIGTVLIGGVGIDVTVNDAGDIITIDASGGADNESIMDLLSTTLVGGTGISATYDDGAGTITLVNTAPYSDESVRDAMGTALVAGANVTVTVDDTANTITIASSGGGSTDVEVVRDTIAAALVGGTGITITPNDGADTITVALTAAAYTDENARDAIGTALVAGTGITVTVNDGADTITVARAAARVVAMTEGATITPNADTTDIGTVTLAGNRAFAAPSGTPVDGQRLMLRLKQDATGSRVPTWNAIYRWPGGTAPTLTTTAAKTDHIGFIYNAADSKWDGVAVRLNF